MSFNNAINATATGLLKASSTGVVTGVTTTNHNILIGSTSNSITNLAPSATSGTPLISQGSSADPAFGTAVVAGGGTGAVTYTAYGVITGGTTSTGALQSVTPGTNPQVLQSNGASSLPTWVTGPSGTNYLVLIQTQNPSGASSVTFTSGISSTYNNYLILMNSIKLSAANPLQLQLSTNGGSTYITTGYFTGQISIVDGSLGTWTNDVNATTYLVSSYLGNSAWYAYAELYLWNATAGSGYVITSGQGVIIDPSTPDVYYTTLQGGYATASTTVNAFKLIPSSGTFSGTISLYGILP